MSEECNNLIDQHLTNKSDGTLELNSDCIKYVTGKSSVRGENTEDLVFQDRPLIDLNFPDINAKASTRLDVSSRGDDASIRSIN